MCGHLSFFDTDKMYERWDVARPQTRLKKNYNVYPGGSAPVILDDGEKRVALRQFGFEVPWSKNLVFNARLETITEKKLFSKKYRESRCLIPASRYFEWQTTDQGKKEFEHSVAGGALFAMAAVCDDDGFAIITTDAWPKLADIHHRMPVVMQRDFEDDWLNPDVVEMERLNRMLTPVSAKDISFAAVI